MSSTDSRIPSLNRRWMVGVEHFLVYPFLSRDTKGRRANCQITRSRWPNMMSPLIDLYGKYVVRKFVNAQFQKTTRNGHTWVFSILSATTAIFLSERHRFYSSHPTSQNSSSLFNKFCIAVKRGALR